MAQANGLKRLEQKEVEKTTTGEIKKDRLRNHDGGRLTRKEQLKDRQIPNKTVTAPWAIHGGGQRWHQHSRKEKKTSHTGTQTELNMTNQRLGRDALRR